MYLQYTVFSIWKHYFYFLNLRYEHHLSNLDNKRDKTFSLQLNKIFNCSEIIN